MFSLVVAIISISLVALLAYASMYFMGNTTSDAATTANTAQVLNTATQIQGAVNLYRNEHAGASPSSFQDLIDGGYLKNIPPGNWSFSNNAIQSNIIISSADQCAAVNKKLYNDPTVPSCSTVSGDKLICCSNP